MTSTSTMKFGKPKARRGMTLIELILVLGILAIVLTASTPMLTNFFKGRRSSEEVRRILALTRFARSEAVSRAVPIEIWIDDREGSYGLREQLTASDEQATEPLEYRLADGLEIAFAPDVTNEMNEGSIVFHPDGTIDPDSIEEIIIREVPNAQAGRRGTDQEYEIRMARSEVGVGFIILDEEAQKNAGKR